MQQEFRQEHAQRAATLINNLSTFVETLHKTVSGLRQEFADDIGGSHQAWLGRTSGGKIPPEKIEPLAKEKEQQSQPVESEIHEKADVKAFDAQETNDEEELDVEAEKTDDIVPDKLTVIRSIGKSREKLLHEAGIFTFAQLAGSTPDDLRDILGDMLAIEALQEIIDQASTHV